MFDIEMIKAEEKVNDYTDEQLINWAKNLYSYWMAKKEEFKDPVEWLDIMGRIEFYKMLVKESKKLWDRLGHTTIYKMALIGASSRHFSKCSKISDYNRTNLINLASKCLPGPPDLMKYDFETSSGKSSKKSNIGFELIHLTRGEDSKQASPMDSEILKITGPVLDEDNFSIIENKGVEFFEQVKAFVKRGMVKKGNVVRNTIIGLDNIAM